MHWFFQIWLACLILDSLLVGLLMIGTLLVYHRRIRTADPEEASTTFRLLIEGIVVLFLLGVLVYGGLIGLAYLTLAHEPS